MELEQTIFKIITHSGDAKSCSMEAISLAKEKREEEALKKIEEAAEKLALAHKEQTKLIQKEAGGDKVEMSLLMVHAQDHLMNAMMIKDLAFEIVDIHKKL